jgi:hypothetical protein
MGRNKSLKYIGIKLDPEMSLVILRHNVKKTEEKYLGAGVFELWKYRFVNKKLFPRI